MYRIVIVEDDPMVSFVNRTYAEKDPRFQVVKTFQNGRSAFQWLVQNPVDLLILDVYMPVLTGLDLLLSLRKAGVLLDAIMVTAANDAKTIDTLLKLGVVDYLVKPFTYQRFQQALNTFCRYRETVTGEAVSQDALDQLLRPGSTSPDATPKGLQPDTLDRIRTCLRSAPGQAMTSEALAHSTGLSAVTVRRYASYLVQMGEWISTMNYDTGGRPCHLYRYPGKD